MKKKLLIMSITLILVLASVIICLALSGCYTVGLEYYNDNEYGYSVNYNGPTTIKKIVIPSKHLGKTVINIGPLAFRDCKNLESVTIPDSVTSIRFMSFSGCTSLANITIPDSVTNIGEWAFEDCTSLTSISLPDNISNIASNAFNGCTSLKYNEYDNALYLGNENNPYLVLIKAKNNSISSCNIHETTRLIFSHAFWYCSYLTNISIPDSVTSIGDKAFYGCSYLTNISIPDSVTTIGYGAFAYCSYLKSVSIPDTVTNIGDNVFTDCNNIIKVTIPSIAINYIPKSNLQMVNITSGISINESAFSGCNKLTNISIPDTITSIASNAFDGCTSLKYNENDNSLYLGNEKNPYLALIKAKSKDITFCNINEDTKMIYHYAFSGCTYLKSISIPDTVTSLGHNAFKGCSSLTSIKLPDTITNIGDDAFAGCPIKYASYPTLAIDYIGKTYLKTVIITSGTTIHSDAFSNCSSLTSVSIPDTITSIGSSAFNGCSSLTSLTLPDSVTSIGNNAFKGCTSLTSISVSPNNIIYHSKGNCLIETESKSLILGCHNSIIPNDGSVTNIGNGAFEGYSFLTSVSIPNTVTNIGSSAFNGCSSLTSLTLPDSVSSIGDDAFKRCTSLTSISVSPNNTVYHSSGNCLIETESKSLISGCNNSIIPNDGSVISIGNGAFERYSSLTSVSIPDTITSIGSNAFNGCSSLTSIAIPDTVTCIGDDAFVGCPIEYASYPTLAIDYIGKTYLKTVIITSGTTIHSGAFSNCSSLTSIAIPNTVTSIGSSAFNGCSSLTSLTLPDSVSSIGDDAFKRCTSLTSISVSPNNTVYHSSGNCLIETESKTLISGCHNSIIPNDGSVISIGDGAFEGYSSLTSISIPDTITSIGSSAFNGCSSLTSLTLPDSVSSIGDDAFKGCNNIVEVTIPSIAINYIPKSNLQMVNITSGISISESAFSGCSKLTSISIPDTITSIGNDAFKGCILLNYNEYDNASYLGNANNKYIALIKIKNNLITYYEINESTKIIYDGVFKDCNYLKSITIPDSVTCIGSSAFKGCISLTTVYWYATNCTISGDSDHPIFENCKNLMKVYFKEDVTTIPNCAFFGCYSLLKVIFKGTKEQWNAVSKGIYWDFNTGNYIVDCNDGIISE